MNFQSRPPLQKGVFLPETCLWQWPPQGRESGDMKQTSLLHTEAFIREGSEFMDHWEVQIESPEDTAGAGACGEGCSLVMFPRSQEAQVPVP